MTAQPHAALRSSQKLGRTADRRQQTTSLLLTAYVDVVDLNGVGHTHAAESELLVRAERAISEHLRSYALIVDVGAEELLCVMCDATVEPARGRFAPGPAALIVDP
jgi:hypothetical protein